VHPEQKRIYQAMTPEQKVNSVFDLYHTARQVKAAYLKKLHPDWTDEMIERKVREIFMYAGS
jgi:hypothetical protein